MERFNCIIYSLFCSVNPVVHFFPAAIFKCAFANVSLDIPSTLLALRTQCNVTDDEAGRKTYPLLRMLLVIMSSYTCTLCHRSRLLAESLSLILDNHDIFIQVNLNFY